MEKVWKCDFCCETNKNPDKIKNHEENCTFNPKFKNCYSCKHYYSYYDMMDCRKNINTWEYEDYDEEYGYCTEWQADDQKLLRKIKLEEINKIIE